MKNNIQPNQKKNQQNKKEKKYQDHVRDNQKIKAKEKGIKTVRAGTENR